MAHPSGGLMNAALKQKNNIIANNIPFTINSLQVEIECLQAFTRQPADSGWTHPKPIGNLFARSQPLQGVEGRQGVQIDHTGTPMDQCEHITPSMHKIRYYVI
jgi:hypothetical protein